MPEKDPNDFAPYAPYLATNIWPTLDKRTGALEQVLVDRDEMPPQYAASALAKLVRWARIAPEGETAHHGDEDSREEYVRSTALGKALAARAVNLDEDIFFAMYGEFGVTPKVSEEIVGAMLMVLLEEAGLDWSPKDRYIAAFKMAKGLLEEFNVHMRVV